MTLPKMNRTTLGSNIVDSLVNIRMGLIVAAPDETLAELANLKNLLEESSARVLPYSALAEFVYKDEDEDFNYFITHFEEFVNENISTDDPAHEKLMKLLEHLALAKQQKEVLFEDQQQRMLQLEKMQIDLNKKIERTQILSDKVDKLQKSNENMITNFISILGIFAAILMGAFGAIQGFTSLFEHAVYMPLGKALILSSVGGSSVILILFLLLNGISKLTNRPISNSTSNKIKLKHPTIVATYAIMITIALSGAALELSDKEIHYSKAGYWWAIPGFWLLIMLMYFKSSFISKDSKKGNIDNKELVHKKRARSSSRLKNTKEMQG